MPSEEFLWMPATEEGLGTVYSIVCRKHSCRSAKASIGLTVWVNVPCQTLTSLSLVKHTSDPDHLLLRCRLFCSFRKDGRIAVSLEHVAV